MVGALRLARAIAAGELSAREAVQASLDRITARNDELNAVTAVLADEALSAADRVDPSLPLAGVPFTVKENIDVAGTVTTYGIAGGAVAARDAPHVAHLRAAGAICVGRTNLPELAMRWHTDNALHGATLNPFDASLSPGGSSGGEAVALAAGMAAFGVGSDYGGSLRVPAALAGVYSLRPTPGRLAQAFAAEAPPFATRQWMATDGPLAARAEDLGALLEVMAGRSERDPRYVPALGAASRRGPVAVVLGANAAPLAAAGWEVVETELPAVEEAAQLWLDAVGFEVRPLLERVRRDGSEGTFRSASALFGLGRVDDGAGYAAALARRYALMTEWAAFFARHPLVLGPVSTAAPWPVGHDQAGADALREQWWGFRLTVATACLGVPALSLPGGDQLISRWWSERALVDAAVALER